MAFTLSCALEHQCLGLLEAALPAPGLRPGSAAALDGGGGGAATSGYGKCRGKEAAQQVLNQQEQDIEQYPEEAALTTDISMVYSPGQSGHTPCCARDKGPHHHGATKQQE